MDYTITQSSDLKGTTPESVDIDIGNADQDDALRMMYSSGGITVNMETNFKSHTISDADSPVLSNGKDFAIQTKTDFLRVSIERENHGDSLKLYRCKSPLRSGGSAESTPAPSSGSPIIRTPSGGDYRESEEWCEELKFDANNAVVDIPINNLSLSDRDTTPESILSEEKSMLGDDGYFSPERTNQNIDSSYNLPDSSIDIASSSLNVHKHPGNTLSTYSHHEYPTTFDGIRDLHDRSSVHSLSDILDDYPDDEMRQRQRSDRHFDFDSDEDEIHQENLLSTHRLALTGVGLYSVLLECIGTPKWLNAGLTVGAAALIAYDGTKKNRKIKKVPKILEKIKGPWNDEDEIIKGKKLGNRRKKNGNNGIVVSALVAKFQNLRL